MGIHSLLRSQDYPEGQWCFCYDNKYYWYCGGDNGLIWLESHDYTQVRILSDSLSMIRKKDKCNLRRQWLESVEIKYL
jgi:hypothetical protein